MIYRSEYTEGWYQDENGDWYQADPTEGKKPSTTGGVDNSTLRINIYLSKFEHNNVIMQNYKNLQLIQIGAQKQQQANGSVAMSEGGTQPSSTVISSELSEAGLELSNASKEASKQVIKGKIQNPQLSLNNLSNISCITISYVKLLVSFLIMYTNSGILK